MPCYRVTLKDGTVAMLCGKLGPHCTQCGGVGDHLCDYPVGKGKTCDRRLCERCAHEVGPNLHYCAAHRAQWDEFRASGGVQRELENVVPFKLTPPW